MVLRSILVLTAILVAAGSALAAPTADLYRLSGQYSGDGGEFRIAPNQDLMDITAEVGTYSSFAVVYDTTFVATTYEAEVSTATVAGDALDGYTAYLYTAFREGTLAGYSYVAGAPRVASAGALQDVIWFVEGEAAKTWTDGDNSLQDQFYTAAVNANWTDIGNVRVLNLYELGHAGDANYAVKDQLTMISPVPAPGAMLIASLGTMIVGWLRSRKAI